MQRAGRVTKKQQQALDNYADTYLINYNEKRVLDFAEAFGNNNPVTFEIGFGMGKSLVEMAKKHGKDPGQIAIRYLIQLGYSVAFLTSSDKRMASNMEVFDFELTDEEVEMINELNQASGSWGLPSPHELP